MRRGRGRNVKGRKTERKKKIEEKVVEQGRERKREREGERERESAQWWRGVVMVDRVMCARSNSSAAGRNGQE